MAAEPEILEIETVPSGESLLRKALLDEVPIVVFLGQSVGWSKEYPDPVLAVALQRASRIANDWKSLLSREPLPESFYEWLGERFLNRSPSQELLLTADGRFSAIYTSSIDPTLVNLFSTDGRQPEPVLIGDPPPAVSRSRRRLPIYYLFGRAGAGIAGFIPPNTTQLLSQRRLRHASSMLRTLNETATPLGLIVIDGYDPSRDWLKADDLLAVLGSAPIDGVLWCGEDPQFSDEDDETYKALVEHGVIVRDKRPLGQLMAQVSASGDLPESSRWDDAEVVSLSDGAKLITTPRLRLSTEASAAIIDDSWLGFLSPLTKDGENTAFSSFHAVPAGPLGLLEGLRRNFAIKRDFEEHLEKRVIRALSQHHLETGAIVLHGQSGVGKTVALGRLALAVRKAEAAAVLIAYNRFLQPSDVGDFLAEVDKLGGVTLVIVDATASFQRYDDLLEAFRSRGHRTVVIGTSYRLDLQQQVNRSRFIEVSSELSNTEREGLQNLSERFGVGNHSKSQRVASQPHALARFFWELPSSRAHISEGLGREARATEIVLRTKGSARRPSYVVSSLAAALIDAGYSPPTTPLLVDGDQTEPTSTSAAGRVIDYVMAASRLYKWLPVNLLLRAVLTHTTAGSSNSNLEVVRELFEGQDVFRWRFADEQGEELVVGARLQIEAELICNRRLGGPQAEAACLMELIASGVRAGSENNEESKFLIDLVFALGPDGPFKERYKDSYSSIARTLTDLRKRQGVLNARLMLQEATLRRHHIRTHQLSADEKVTLLDEARAAVDDALQALNSSSARLYASKRTRDHLWVERAATYGFLATDSAGRGASSQEIWSSYKAAREAVRKAAGRVDSYFPLDIGLWLPADILRATTTLGSNERSELEADIRSTLDLVDPDSLDALQNEIFQRQRLRVGDTLSDVPLSDEAFAALARIGSTAGYFLRARQIAPKRPEAGEVADTNDQAAAKATANYLWSVYDKVSSDARCLELLLSSEWTALTGRWLFRGQRQPLPFKQEDRIRVRSILLDLLSIGSEQVQARYRYLEAVLNWITNDDVGARQSFSALASETEFIDKSRVISRHVLTDPSGQPIIFDGIVERQLAEKRWSVFIAELSRRVDLVESGGDRSTIIVGKAMHGISVSFNYLGPLVDRFLERTRRT